MRISVVIPVFNEADYLPACLSALRKQTKKPHEVIVVDNNSTDDSAAVASAYGARVVQEPRQGVVFAREAGFAAATGDVIARLDGESIPSSDWLEQITAQFVADTTLGAITGSVSYYDMALPRVVSRVDLMIRHWLAARLAPDVAAQGANAAFRRSAWQAVRKNVSSRTDIHEDFDLSLHISSAGYRLAFVPEMHVAISPRRAESSFKDALHYALVSPKTYKVHGRRSRWHMYPVIAFIMLFFVPVKLLYRANARDASGMLALFKKRSPRPSPVD